MTARLDISEPGFEDGADDFECAGFDDAGADGLLPPCMALASPCAVKRIRYKSNELNPMRSFYLPHRTRDVIVQ